MAPKYDNGAPDLGYVKNFPLPGDYTITAPPLVVTSDAVYRNTQLDDLYVQGLKRFSDTANKWWMNQYVATAQATVARTPKSNTFGCGAPKYDSPPADSPEWKKMLKSRFNHANLNDIYEWKVALRNMGRDTKPHTWEEAAPFVNHLMATAFGGKFLVEELTDRMNKAEVELHYQTRIVRDLENRRESLQRTLMETERRLRTTTTPELERLRTRARLHETDMLAATERAQALVVERDAETDRVVELGKKVEVITTAYNIEQGTNDELRARNENQTAALNTIATSLGMAVTETTTLTDIVNRAKLLASKPSYQVIDAVYEHPAMRGYLRGDELMPAFIAKVKERLDSLVSLEAGPTVAVPPEVPVSYYVHHLGKDWKVASAEAVKRDLYYGDDRTRFLPGDVETRCVMGSKVWFDNLGADAEFTVTGEGGRHDDVTSTITLEPATERSRIVLRVAGQSELTIPRSTFFLHGRKVETPRSP